jgi:hypothetical protein
VQVVSRLLEFDFFSLIHVLVKAGGIIGFAISTGGINIGGLIFFIWE